MQQHKQQQQQQLSMPFTLPPLHEFDHKSEAALAQPSSKTRSRSSGQDETPDSFGIENRRYLDTGHQQSPAANSDIEEPHCVGNSKNATAASPCRMPGSKLPLIAAPIKESVINAFVAR